MREYMLELEQAVNIMNGQTGMGGFESESESDKYRKAKIEYEVFKKEGLL